MSVAGPIEQPHVRPWSTVLRVPTSDGDVWFKANMAVSMHEAAVVRLLAGRRPDCTPPLLAADLERGWMLIGDGGARLREVLERERDLGRWDDVLPLRLVRGTSVPHARGHPAGDRPPARGRARRPELDRFPDVYLEPWAGHGSREELLASVELALLLGGVWLSRKWHLVVSNLEPHERDEWVDAVPVRLRLFLEAADAR
ncbi:MAG: hypothetical protein ACRDNX_12030 [Gaiellaceae bacterium]